MCHNGETHIPLVVKRKERNPVYEDFQFTSY